MNTPAILLLGLLCTSTAVLAGDNDPASPEGVPNTFAELDADGNGLISHAEAAKSSGVAEKFAAADANDDGALTTDEFAGLLMASQEK